MVRPPDPLEIRAREMAVAAGIDPDSRIAKPGSERGMPAWCSYRDLARAERNVEQAIAASAQMVNLRPQEPQFQNSPLTVFGDPDEATLLQIKNCMSVGHVMAAVLCADSHLGYSQSVGAAVVYQDQLSVSGTGFDIGCGHAAMKTDVTFGAIKHRLPMLIEDINRHIIFGLGGRGNDKVDDEIFDDQAAWSAAAAEPLRLLAKSQMFSYGTSNHFLDLLYEVPSDPSIDFDPDEQLVWIAIHSGSRGVGHKIATENLKVAGGKDGIHTPPALLDVATEAGQRYLAGMTLSGRYATKNRFIGVDKVRQILGGTCLDLVTNHHNWTSEEEHFGQKVWITRKGATAAFPGQRGFVGGSMGDDAVIIEGIDSERARASYYTTVHGAGRVMSRTQAKKTFTRREMDEWLHQKGVTLVGGGLDESPMSYRRLDDVLRYHEGMIKINQRLRPFLVVMASDEQRRRDPYRE